MEARLPDRPPVGHERAETGSGEDDHTDDNEYYFHRVTGPCQDIDGNAESVSERLRSERPGRGDPKQSDSQCFAQARSAKQRQPGDDKGKEEYRLTSKVQIGKGHYSILSVSLCVSGSRISPHNRSCALRPSPSLRLGSPRLPVRVLVCR